MSERLGEGSSETRDSSAIGMSKHAMYAIQAMAGMFFAGCLLCFVLLVLPFSPHALYGYEGLDTTVCAGEPVEVWADKETSSGYQIEDAHVTSYWRDPVSGDTVGSSDTSIPLPVTAGRVADSSPVYRDAPDRAGSYKLVTDVTVNGRILFMPRHQKIHTVSDQTLTVLSKDSPQCEKEEG